MSFFFLLAAMGALAAIVLIVISIAAVTGSRRRAREFGYPSVSAYLNAVPASDAEKRDAVNLAVKGVVICLLGLLFPPFLLIGLVPLFYGTRKVSWASMGLGLVDDGERSSL